MVFLLLHVLNRCFRCCRNNLKIEEMKPLMKILLLGVVMTFTAAEMNAQAARKTKKKDQDIAYMEQKKRADEERRLNAAETRRSDSLRRVAYRDSISNARLSDSVRYSKMGASDSVLRARMNCDTLGAKPTDSKVQPADDKTKKQGEPPMKKKWIKEILQERRIHTDPKLLIESINAGRRTDLRTVNR
jgi:hypothetical protein